MNISMSFITEHQAKANQDTKYVGKGLKIKIKRKKLLYLSSGVKVTKNKGTSLSQTLKVGENKEPLIFAIAAYGPRYGHLLHFKRCISSVNSF